MCHKMIWVEDIQGVPKNATLLSSHILDLEKDWIKSISWEYSSCDEYLKEYFRRKMLENFLLQAVLPRNRLDSMD